MIFASHYDIHYMFVHFQYTSSYLPNLSNGGVDLEDLLMTFDLPDTDLTGELIGCWTVALQRKGTLQRRLVTAPHLREGEFLQQREKREYFRTNQ